MVRGKGLRVRFSRVRGLTGKAALPETMYLPVVLGEFSVSEEFVHRTYETHRAGQYSVPSQGGKSARQLRTTDFETLTIDWEAAWLVEYADPADFQRAVLRLARSKRPFQVTAVVQFGLPNELTMMAVITSLTRSLRPGEADTRYWSLSLQEYRDPRVTRHTPDQGARGVKLPTKRKLLATDTLESLARKYYGTPRLWTAIAQANGIKRGKFGQSTELVKHDRFKVGDFVKIPRKPAPARPSTGGVRAPD